MLKLMIKGYKQTSSDRIVVKLPSQTPVINVESFITKKVNDVALHDNASCRCYIHCVIAMFYG